MYDMLSWPAIFRWSFLRGNLASALALLIVGTGLSAGAALLQKEYEIEAAKQRFATEARARFISIQTKFDLAVENLHSVEALFHHLELESSREGFLRFASDLANRHPEIHRLYWVPNIIHKHPEDPAVHTHMLLDHHHETHADIDEGILDLMPVEFLSPMGHEHDDERLNLRSDPELMELMTRAQNTGALAADFRSHDMNTKNAHVDYLVVKPMYNLAEDHRSIHVSQHSLHSFIIGIVSIDNIVDYGLSELPPGGADLWLFAGSHKDGKNLVHYHPSRTRPTSERQVHRVNSAPAVPNSDALVFTDHAVFAGQDWEMVAAAAPGFDGTQEWEAWAIFVSGILLTLIMLTYLLHIRAANAESHRTSMMMRVILESIPARVFWKDRDLRYLGCNRLFARDAGVEKPEDLIGLTDYDVAWTSNAEEYRADDRKVLTSLEPYLGYEEEQQRPSGDTAYLVTSKTPLWDLNGAVIGVLGTYEDVTERKAIEARLNQSQKMEAVGQLTGGLAHDFNNILAIIVGSLDLLKLKLTDTAQLKHVERAIDATVRGSALTRRLLAFSRRQSLKPEVTDINALVTSLFDLFDRTLGASVALETALAEDLPSTMVDPAQLENAILNLAINARDAMPQGGKLTIETARVELDEEYAKLHPSVSPGSYCMIAVTDTGSGMTPEIVSKVFDPFFTTKDVGKGTGLGLSMVYGFVTQSKGHVNVYSEVGRGTSVMLYLPERVDSSVIVREANEAPSEPAMKLSRAEREKITILVAEDNDEVRQVVVSYLQDLGYRLLIASNGPEALALLDNLPEGESIDVLFSDVVMPGGMTGPELAAEVSRRVPDVKVLFTSGNPRNAFERSYGTDPDAPLLVKPYRNNALSHALEELLLG